jgi:hypothetical protein
MQLWSLRPDGSDLRVLDEHFDAHDLTTAASAAWGQASAGAGLPTTR